MRRLNARWQHPFKINAPDVEFTKSFVYHGTAFDISGRAEQWYSTEVIENAKSTFYRLSKVLWTSEFRVETKVITFYSNIITVLLCWCETWRMKKVDANRLDTYFNNCLRRILKVHWPMHVNNEEMGRKAGVEKMSTQLHRRWWWIGHVLRITPDCNPLVALIWTLSGRISQGRRK